MVTEKATEWLSPAYDEETQKEVSSSVNSESMQAQNIRTLHRNPKLLKSKEIPNEQ